MIHFHPLYFVHGIVLVVLGGTMLLPAGVSAILGEPGAATFFLSSFATVSIGGFFVLVGRGREVRLTRKEGFLLTASVWVSISFFAALPIAFSVPQIDFVAAIFETVAGLTTTGSTVLSGLDHMPKGLLLWRGLLQWLGGMGVVAMVLVLLPFLQIGGMQLFRTESSDRSERLLPGARQIAIAILVAYATLSGLCALAFWIEGMNVLDAAVHAMATLSTGGFSNYDESFAHFRSYWMRGTATLFMLAGALPMVWFLRLGRGDWRALHRDSQVRTFIGVLVVATLVLAGDLILSRRMSAADGLSHAAFSVVSIATTTGFVSADYARWGSFATGLLFLLTFVGGCTGSTAGGIKIFRFEILYRLITLHVRKLVNPHAVAPIKYGGRLVGDDALFSVMAFLVAYLVTVGVIAIGLALLGLDPMTSLTGAAAAVGNVGPGFGPIIGPLGNFAPLPDAAKMLLALGMLLGRLEFFTVLALLSPSFWRA
jgi:trk system potassium uptake protein TrkH